MEKPRKQYIILNKKLQKLDANELIGLLQSISGDDSDDGIKARRILDKLGINLKEN